MKTSVCLLCSAVAVGTLVVGVPALHAQQATNFWVTGSTLPTKIELRIDGTFLAEGIFTGANSLPPQAALAGTRMFWYPAKAAFRAGGVSSNGYYSPWSDSYIGRYSFATGYDTQASGLYSFAAGANSRAAGDGSIAMGVGASTYYSNEVAIGQGANTFYGGLAIGPQSRANYQGAAFGYASSADYGSVAVGKSATGNNSSGAFGHNVSANNNGTSLGQFSGATGSFSTALGAYNVADGSYATALGHHTTARAYGSTVVGQFNVIQGIPGIWVATDPLFVVGNGTSVNAMSDAFTVYKNGDAYFSKTLRVEPRGDIPMFVP